MQRFGRVDVWINNAGHGILDSAAQVDIALVRDTFDTNFFGALIAMQAVIPIMRKQSSGAIINISSVAGHIPLPFHSIYSATKFASERHGKAARVELKSAGIHVMTVCPGYVRTDFSANALKGNEQKRVRPSSVRGISAERVAYAVLRGYEKKKREVIVPWTMHPMVKLYQLFPGLVEWSMARMAEPSRSSKIYPRLASMASISDCAWPLPVLRAEAIPSTSIFFASSLRPALSKVCAAIKYPTL